ncbi:multicopper oxidase family protein [Legionella bononiensis]|uniref:Multicopper oxidase family protein n=1 Tax=Legionella bononiensis TaxID=2793102 RepID=A0ABS1W7Q4_9GAMM|nr:multicopper oxidase family protein [Legionella bononiensis]MBL7480106.1 multicopper oxidase family protein [Legionella bononiensis]MBL7525379.1 multicopper oxidase family protein [Legionella bononiensis]MBL7561563.1 multicopper oxidase family protein [Legionella bononiensis]
MNYKLIYLLSGLFLLATGQLTAAEANKPIELIIKKYPVEVNGKASELFRIEQPDGTWGFQGIKGQWFDAIVKNTSDKPTVIHWHGLIVPNDQDGVPYVTQPPVPAGGSYHYRFKLKQSGTYWMHSHYDLQEQKFLSAPFILLDPQEKKADKDVIFMIGDFSFKSPETILASLKKGTKMPMNTTQDSMTMSHTMDKSMEGSKPDLNDVTYDAILTNYKTLKNPEIVHVKPGDSVRLRIIAGSSMTNFFINTGALSAQAIAVDGQNIKPFEDRRFQIAVGQRLDLMVKIPDEGGSFPILAQGEGTSMQTGLILATDNAQIVLPKEQASSTSGAFNYDQELKIEAVSPLLPKTPELILTVTLDGDMVKYIWTLNKQAWPDIKPLEVSLNKRVELVFINNTSMAHPMHLHGHLFEVTEIDGKSLKNGAMRDTVLVLPKSTVKIQFDTDNPGNWMLHCHMLYHQATGMMTFMNYKEVKIPNLNTIKKME